ncbi:hypothetical protein CTheo_8679 [Ceratobasidium theobromae]|uniref:Uncharacterized protein n=1 Tax=Ceratobasidium theobromae TaxID=1582974 RepID=A0A5N5Q864_9AGAM|nr:hypothetical protein CTheo_8679 [Ceratobasidium theobromae]
MPRPALEQGPTKLTPSVIISSSISAFQKYSGIDISEGQEYLEYHELTPDIIHAVPYQHLADILKVTKGNALKYQLFCQEFYNKLDSS